MNAAGPNYLLHDLDEEADQSEQDGGGADGDQEHGFLKGAKISLQHQAAF
jgi:hypothetical protein